MKGILLGMAITVAAGLLSLLTSRWPRVSVFIGALGSVVGSVIGSVPAVMALVAGHQYPDLQFEWTVPFDGSTSIPMSVGIDPLSAFFVVGAFLHGALSALAGTQYLFWYQGRKPLGLAGLMHAVMVASMVLVVIARNGLLFLVAWELMALSSFFLVVWEDERSSVRAAGRSYLIAAHIGVAFLFAFFLIAARYAGSLNFADLGSPGKYTSEVENLLFLLAVIGFGTKAGFMPLHVWLPESYAAAPGYVSAVLSGVMSKLGIYGLLRVLFWLPNPPTWWGWLLIVIGLVSGLWGILLAIAQRNLKRLLAYSSIENIGVIAVGLGAGLLAKSSNMHVLAVLSFAGALLHVVNHGVFKSLLFLGAGAVRQSTGTLDIEQLGGMAKRMPWVGFAFLVGSVAISGLPPFNGFVSEFFIYMGVFQTEISVSEANPLAAESGLGVIAELSMISGFAAACFAKAHCMVFLGEPRTHEAAEAEAPSWLLTGPMLFLAASCLGLAFGAPRIVEAMLPVLQELNPGIQLQEIVDHLDKATRPLDSVIQTAAFVLVLAVVFGAIRKLLLSRREVGWTVTWDCGYAKPTPRIQYTGSSFVEPLSTFFGLLIRTRKNFVPPQGLFPQTGSFSTETPDVLRETIYQRSYDWIFHLTQRLRWLQHGRVHLYVLYIAATAVLLLVWFLSRS